MATPKLPEGFEVVEKSKYPKGFSPVKKAPIPEGFEPVERLPQGYGNYDYSAAKEAGLGPDETGHWPSRVPGGKNKGMILKSEDHQTFPLTVQGEMAAGYELYKNKKGQIYSFKKGESIPEGFEPYDQGLPPGFEIEDERKHFGIGEALVQRAATSPMARLGEAIGAPSPEEWNPLEQSLISGASKTFVGALAQIPSAMQILKNAPAEIASQAVKTVALRDFIPNISLAGVSGVAEAAAEKAKEMPREELAEQRLFTTEIPDWMVNNGLQEIADNASEAYSYNQRTYPGQDLFSLWNEGRVEEAADWLANSLAENSPYIIMTTALNMFGVPPVAVLETMGTVAGLSKIGDVYNKQDVTKYEQMENVFLTGLYEGISEYFGAKMFGFTTSLFRSIGTKAGQKVVEESIQLAISKTPLAKGLLAVGSTVVEESLEEFAVEIAGGLTDMYHNIEDQQTFSGVLRQAKIAAIQGGIMGGGMQSAGSVASASAYLQTDAKVLNEGLSASTEAYEDNGVDLRPSREELVEERSKLLLRIQGHTNPETGETLVLPEDLNAEEIELLENIEEALQNGDYRIPEEENIESVAMELGADVLDLMENQSFEGTIKEKMIAGEPLTEQEAEYVQYRTAQQKSVRATDLNNVAGLSEEQFKSWAEQKDRDSYETPEQVMDALALHTVFLERGDLESAVNVRESVVPGSETAKTVQKQMAESEKQFKDPEAEVSRVVADIEEIDRQLNEKETQFEELQGRAVGELESETLREQTTDLMQEIEALQEVQKNRLEELRDLSRRANKEKKVKFKKPPSDAKFSKKSVKLRLPSTLRNYLEEKGNDLLSRLRRMTALEISWRAYQSKEGKDFSIDEALADTGQELDEELDEILNEMKGYYDEWLKRHNPEGWVEEILDPQGDQALYSSPSEAFTDGRVGLISMGNTWRVDVEDVIVKAYNDELATEEPGSFDDVISELEDYSIDPTEIEEYKARMKSGDEDAEFDARDKWRELKMEDGEYWMEVFDGREISEQLDAYGWDSPVGELVQRVMANEGYKAWRDNWGNELAEAEDRIQEARDLMEDAGSVDEKLVAVNQALQEQHVYGLMSEHMDLSADDLQELSDAGDEIKDFDSLFPASLRFARGEQAEGSDAESIRAAITELVGKWENAPDIEVVKTTKDLPFDTPDDVKGAFYDGKVYLVESNLDSVDDAVFVLAHEVVGHYGLKGILGDSMAPLMDSIYQTNAEIRAKADEIIDEYGYSRPIAVEEVLADMAQDAKKPEFWDTVIAYIRDFLRSIGIAVSLNANDINYLLSKSHQYVKRGVETSRFPTDARFKRKPKKATTKQRVERATGIKPTQKKIIQTEKQALKNQLRMAAKSSRASFVEGKKIAREQQINIKNRKLEELKLKRLINKLPIQGMHAEESTKIKQLREKFRSDLAEENKKLRDLDKRMKDKPEAEKKAIRKQKAEIKKVGTLEYLREFYLKLYDIKEFGKKRHEFLKEQRAIRREAWAESLLETISAVKAKPKKTIGQDTQGDWIRGAQAFVLRPMRVIDGLDGGANFSGEHFEIFYNNINEAEDNKLVALMSAMKKGSEIYKKHGVTEKRLAQKRIIDRHELSIDDIMHIYKAQENPENLAAIVLGNEISLSTIKKAVDLLTPAEMRAADEIAEEMGSHYDRIREALLNYTDGKEDMGEAVGTYIPMWRDQFVTTGTQQELMDDLMRRQNLRKSFVKHGMTKSRFKVSQEMMDKIAADPNAIPESKQSPIRLGLAHIYFGHIEKREHFVAYADPVKDIQFLSSQVAWRKKVAEKFGKGYLKVVDSWVNRMSNPSFYKTTTVIDKMIQVARKNAAIVNLGFNIITMLKQAPSLALFVNEMGVSDLLGGINDLMTDFNNKVDTIHRLAPQMKNRVVEREIQEFKRIAPNEYERIVNKVGETTMKGIMAIDMLVTHAGWLGKYNELMRSGEFSEQEAAAESTRVVMRTQPAASPKDQANLYALNELANAFLQFTNQLSNIYSIVTYDIPMRIRLGDQQRAVVGGMGVVLSAMAIWILSNGRLPRDDEDWSEMALHQSISILPFAGNIIEARRLGFSGSPAAFQPMLSVVDALKAAKRGNLMRAGEKSLEVGAYIVPFPFRQPVRTVKGAAGTAMGDKFDWKQMIWSQYALYGPHGRKPVVRASSPKDKSKFIRYYKLRKEITNQVKAIKESPSAFSLSMEHRYKALKKTVNRIDKLIRDFKDNQTDYRHTEIMSEIDSLLKQQ